MVKKSKTRLTIGMLINTFDDDYEAEVWNHIADAAIDYDVNLLFFVGRPLSSPFGKDYQHNSIYNLISEKNLDGLIIFTATIGTYIPLKELTSFCKQFRQFPVVCFGQNIKGIPSIVFDNEVGLKELIDHLVRVHGYKRIAFIKGPETHQEANIRYNTYLKTLKKHNIPFDPDLVVSGNFWYDTGVEAIKLLLEKRKVKCDVIVSSNDYMAIGAIEYLQGKGIRVPQDIALTGFDDTKQAKTWNPPLTTVAQPIYEQARKAFEVILAQMKGEKVPGILYIPSHAIFRQSCGCSPHSISYFDSEIKYQKLNKEKSFKNLKINQDKIFANIIRKLKLKNINNKMLFDWLYKVLMNIIECIKSGDYMNKDFVHIISQLPTTHMEIASREDFWYDVIKILYSNILINVTDNDTIILLELIYQKARLVLSELLVRSNHFQSINEHYTLLRFRQANLVLITSFKLNKLFSELANHLPELGIHRCYISFYTAPVKMIAKYIWDIPQKSQLVFAFYNNQHFSLNDKKIIFPTLELVPKKYFPVNKRHSMILLPLVFEDEYFGFIIFELSSRIATTFESLLIIISSSLKGALLFKKQNEGEKLLRQQKEDLSQNLEKMRKAMAGFIKTMSSTVEVRDPYTAHHQVRVSDLARSIAAEMKLDPSVVESLRMAAIIHDLGKIYVPADILNKPGRLTEAEFTLIKSHPQIAFDILKYIDFPWPIAQIILQHHERLDGSGYPKQLKEKEILLEAKILAVADVVEAMSSHRPYRPALGIDKALAEIIKNKAILYDAEVVDACVNLFRKKAYNFR
jgi:putative nucleotidyltransferase with HDIG domain